MKSIPLHNYKGDVVANAIVDDNDFDWLSQFKWHLSSSGYARDRAGYMHRLIMSAPKGMEVDHINHEKLDNQRSNLRVCTDGENSRNQITSSGKSRYRGVYLHPDGKWCAQIKLNHKRLHIGLFHTEIEAARARDLKALELHGSFACLNLPELQEAQS